jgi:hypothetical protein
MPDSYLEKYNPQTPIFTHFYVDESLPVRERAFGTWKALLSAKRTSEGLFLIIGKLLKDVRDGELYLQLDYENFSQFLASEELGFSREKAYMCIKTYEYFVEHLELDPERVGQMNISRLSMMVPLLKKIENKEEAIRQIEELNSMRHNDFIKEVKARTRKDGKPNVYYSEEIDMWVIQYHPNITHLQALENFDTTEVYESESVTS